MSILITYVSLLYARHIVSIFPAHRFPHTLPSQAALYPQLLFTFVFFPFDLHVRVMIQLHSLFPMQEKSDKGPNHSVIPWINILNIVEMRKVDNVRESHSETYVLTKG